jgi:hypothetical protein
MWKLILGNPYAIGGLMAAFMLSNIATGLRAHHNGYKSGKAEVTLEWNAERIAMQQAHIDALKEVNRDHEQQIEEWRKRLEAAKQVERDPGLVGERAADWLCDDADAAPAAEPGRESNLSASVTVQTPTATTADNAQADRGATLGAEIVESVDLADHWAAIYNAAKAQGERKGIW